MCGIVGYIGKREPKGILYDGLAKLEYRGYDSAGISILGNDGTINTQKSVGKLVNLGEILAKLEMKGNLGIGHTRWATHGKPSTVNSHPHLSGDGKISLVHNGIIENYAELREELKAKGHIFLSETDTEVIVHLIEEHHKGDLFETVKRIIPMLDGAYAIGVFTQDEPNRLITARKGSPLVIGLGEEENLIASDIPAILEHTNKVIFLDDGELAELTRDEVKIYDLEGNPKEKEITEITWTLEASEKGGYDHFMLKEVFEQPRAINDTLKANIEIDLTDKEIEEISRIHIVACGTSWHAGLVGKAIIEQELRIPVEVEVASEFRYKNPIVTDKDLVILISQSGETADTLAGLREAKKHGAKAIGIINVVGSTISREADGTFYTNAGPEIGVASTKAFVAQLTALYKFTAFLGRKRGMSQERADYILDGVAELPAKVVDVLDEAEHIKNKKEMFVGVNSTMFIGRGVNTAIALEGALKLKEISYIHAEGYASGELKHGPIALIDDMCPTVAIATKSAVYEKTKSNIEEVRARSGEVLTIATVGDTEAKNYSSEVIFVPEVDELFSPIINVIPLQILSYYVAVDRGVDVDKPRNLAKSVTVE